jgi:hypothetical protein
MSEQRDCLKPEVKCNWQPSDDGTPILVEIERPPEFLSEPGHMKPDTVNTFPQPEWVCLVKEIPSGRPHYARVVDLAPVDE